MTDSIKRLNYFDGQFLRAPDFTEEQTYHLEMGRRHNQKLHTWGIADGLKLQYTIGSSQIEIAEGMAIDSEGREIVQVNKVNRDLSTFPGKTVYITIAYNERKVDETKETGVEGFTRVQEIANINVSENPPSADQLSLQLILGRVTVNSEGKITATDEGEGVNRRRAAGVVAGDLEARSLTLTDPNVDPSQWSKMRLGAAGRADLNGDLRVTGKLEVTGTVDGRDVSADGTKLDTHTSNTNNPHQTTAAQIDNQGGTNRLVTQINASTGVISEARIDPAIARDSEVTTAINLAVRKAGDTMTGALTIQSNLTVTGNVSLGSLTVNGRMSVSDGVIQRGGAPLTTTADLGLYSQLDSQWIRFVTKNAPFLFYSDGGAGTTPMFIIEPSGSVQATSFLGDGSTLTGVVKKAGDTMTGALTIQNNLTVTGNVGIATTAPPSEKLEVNGNIKATSFLGDGSNLTGVVKNLDSVVKKAGDTMTGVLTIQNNLTVTGNISGNIDAVNITSGILSVDRIPSLVATRGENTFTGTQSINGDLSVQGEINWGNSSRLQADQGGSIELGGDTSTPGGGTPYIDFHFAGLTQDFNTRIINDANGRLSLVAQEICLSSGGGGTPVGAMSIDVGTFGTMENAVNSYFFRVRDIGAGPSTPFYIRGDGQVFGQFAQSSSKELKENIGLLCLQEAAQILAGLNPVKFNYKTDSDQHQNIGFIAEDVPELLATSDRKGVSIMDIVGVLTKVLQEQQKTILELAEKVKSLEAKIPNCDLG
jgi:cytoskeletal protein CcmA (bactofilin family)